MQDGNLTQARVSELLAETLRVRFDLGLFDPTEGQPYLLYGEADVNTVRIGGRGGVLGSLLRPTRVFLWRRTRRAL